LFTLITIELVRGWNNLHKKYKKELEVGCWKMEERGLMLDVGCWVLDAGRWMLDVVCWMLHV